MLAGCFLCFGQIFSVCIKFEEVWSVLQFTGSFVGCFYWKYYFMSQGYFKIFWNLVNPFNCHIDLPQLYSLFGLQSRFLVHMRPGDVYALGKHDHHKCEMAASVSGLSRRQDLKSIA